MFAKYRTCCAVSQIKSRFHGDGAPTIAVIHAESRGEAVPSSSKGGLKTRYCGISARRSRSTGVSPEFLPLTGLEG
jgi:hypothetical protein